jgi:predicted ATP-dependent endonuclease of OLD family
LFLDFQGKTTLLIGENDCCKTTILEAIDLCFNGKLEQEDLRNLNFPAEENNCAIACVFDENIKQDAEERWEVCG